MMFGEYKKTWLYAPKDFWGLSDEVKEKLANGCGPSGWLNKLISDKIYGLNIKIVCDIHDYMYSVGITHADREEADRVFGNNLQRVIWQNTKNIILLKLRLRKANKYYQMVRKFGGVYFWAGKNPKQSMMEV